MNYKENQETGTHNKINMKQNPNNQLITDERRNQELSTKRNEIRNHKQTTQKPEIRNGNSEDAKTNRIPKSNNFYFFIKIMFLNILFLLY